MVAWVEGGDQRVSGMGRDQLPSADKLIIWTTPTSSAVLKAVLGRIKPNEIFLIAADPGFNQADRFLNQLAGMCRYALARQAGDLNLGRLAAGLAQTEGAVRLGIDWLQAKGHISVISEGITGLVISESPPSDLGLVDAETTFRNLNYLLLEAAAFRRFIHTSPINSLQSLFSL